MDNNELVHLCTLIATEQDAIDRASHRLADYRVDGEMGIRAQRQADNAMMARNELIAKLRAGLTG